MAIKKPERGESKTVIKQPARNRKTAATEVLEENAPPVEKERVNFEAPKRLKTEFKIACINNGHKDMTEVFINFMNEYVSNNS
jgi:hypothetical protein